MITKKVKSKQIDFVLQHAAAELERNGWDQGRLGIPDGPKCAVGAINHVIFGSPTTSTASTLGFKGRLRDAAFERLIATTGMSGGVYGQGALRIYSWNDWGDKTRAKVIEAFRIAGGLEPSEMTPTDDPLDVYDR